MLNVTCKFIILCSLCNFTACNITIEFEPSTNSKVKENDILTVYANLTVNNTNGALDSLNDNFRLVILEKNPSNAKLHNRTMGVWRVCENERNFCNEFQLEIRGEFVGWAEFEIFNEFDAHLPLSVYKVGVLRTTMYSLLSNIFSYTMSVLICINTFVMGLQLDWKIILSVLRRPIAPIIGFCCQFVIMPVVSFGWASLLLNGLASLQFGYFAVGCAPGGGASNFWTLLLDGNLDLSVTMTFCSNMAALGMMPFWLYTLGQVFFRNMNGAKEQISIPFENILLSLVLLIVPCLAGILAKRFWPGFAEKSKKVIKIMTLIVVSVAIIFGTIVNTYVYSLITWKTVLCGMLLPWSGFTLSYIIAFALRQNPSNCRTIAIETGIQNANIAIVLLNFSLEKPDSDLTLVMPICVLLFTPIPLIIALICKKIYEKFFKKPTRDDAEKTTEKPTNQKIASNDVIAAKVDSPTETTEKEKPVSDVSDSENAERKHSVSLPYDNPAFVSQYM